MKKSYYEILGVSRSATSAEINSAYRKLAAKLHPDANPDSQEAKNKFREVGQAYETLSNPQKREEYDRSGATSTPFNANADGSKGRDPFEEMIFRSQPSGQDPIYNKKIEDLTEKELETFAAQIKKLFSNSPEIARRYSFLAKVLEHRSELAQCLLPHALKGQLSGHGEMLEQIIKSEPGIFTAEIVEKFIQDVLAITDRFRQSRTSMLCWDSLARILAARPDLREDRTSAPNPAQ